MCQAEVHNSVVDLSVRYYEKQGRHCYATPLSYLSLLALFKRLYTARVSREGEQASRLDNGLGTLKRTAAQVQQLAEELQRTTVRCRRRYNHHHSRLLSSPASAVVRGRTAV